MSPFLRVSNERKTEERPHQLNNGEGTGEKGRRKEAIVAQMSERARNYRNGEGEEEVGYHVREWKAL